MYPSFIGMEVINPSRYKVGANIPENGIIDMKAH
jgi:hypothetical protein